MSLDVLVDEMIGLDRSRKEVHLAASFEAVIAGSLDARTTTFTLS